MLKLKNIDAFYGKIQVLRHVTLHVAEREIVALIGSNGAGKTTLLNVISGLHPAANGSRVFQGKEIRGMSPEKIVALGLVQVPEADKIFPPLSVTENLELGAYLRKLDGRQRQQEMETIFSLFPLLRARRDQPAGTLSGGERQMLALGKGLMAKPLLLMLDEPSFRLSAECGGGNIPHYPIFSCPRNDRFAGGTECPRSFTYLPARLCLRSWPNYPQWAWSRAGP